MCYNLLPMGSFVDFGANKRHFRGSDVHRVPKAWGEEHWIVNKEYCGKKLILKKNRRCSLHTHQKKDEVFYIVSGKVLMEIGDDVFTLLPGDFVHIPPGAYHRFTGLEQSEIIEFSTNHKENDSFRREFSGHSDPERYARQTAILAEFSQLSILVVGDLMLDRYVIGNVERISPEAPIPVVRIAEEREVPGGAANSAANIRALGAKVEVLGIVGDDAAGVRLSALLKERKIRARLWKERRPTIVKERVVGRRGQQIVRLDREDSTPLPRVAQERLIAGLRKAVKGADAILISDYAKGTITPAVLRAVVSLASKQRIPLVIDPKPGKHLSIDLLSRADLLTPNVREACLLCGEQDLTAEEAGRKLSVLTEGAVFLTRGEQGLDVYSRGKLLAHFDSLAPQVTDVSGAGDTVAAVAALCLAAGGTVSDAADMGNRAAGVVVAKQGTATLSKEELDAIL